MTLTATLAFVVATLAISCTLLPAPATAAAHAYHITDLFHQLGPPLPYPWNTSGFYRIPSMVTAPNGDVLAFALGRFHRTDATPNIVYFRRSTDNGNTFQPPAVLLSDPNNGTEYGGVPVVDPVSGAIHYVHNAASRVHCSACAL